MDSTRDFSQLVERGREALANARELVSNLGQRGRQRRLSGADVEGKGDEPLLHPIVEVALDTPTRFVGGGHDSSARRCKLGPALSVGDRGRDQFGEVEHPPFGIRSSPNTPPHRSRASLIALPGNNIHLLNGNPSPLNLRSFYAR